MMNHKIIIEKPVKVEIDSIVLEGVIGFPKKPSGIVLFAHGSGSSRLSPRNTFVANVLQQKGIATLLIDLLTEEEDEVYEARFDINLLTDRLSQIADWITKNPGTKNLPLGLFGASTGAAAALKASAKLGIKTRAVVSRGGRPDLAMEDLSSVKSPTLLIVGGDDFGVIELNESAYKELRCEKKLEIIEGATHLFEEEGALEEVAKLATDWFCRYFAKK